MNGISGNVAGEAGRLDRDGRHGGGRASPLDECREVAAGRLKDLIAQALEQLKPELLRVIDMAMGAEAYYLYMGALELIRDNQPAIVTAFAQAYPRRFRLACREGARPAARSGHAGKLSLLDPDDLEESLATDMLAKAIRDNCVEELFGLDQRVGLLLDDPDPRQRENPLGPDAIARAMMDALKSVDDNFKSRLLVMTLLSKHLPDAVRELYLDLNRRLARRNVLPSLRVGLRRTARAAPVSSRGTVAATTAGAPAVVAAAAAAGPDSETAAPASEATLLSLQRLQRGHSDAIVWSGLEADALGDGRVNVLHVLRDGAMARASEVDAMTLDIVAMMFDYILDDRRLPDAMKALIGRLQIPVLRVAMRDRGFFAKKGHRVRKLLDALAGAAMCLDAGESGLYPLAEKLVARIQEQFDEGDEIFAAALAELDDFLAGEQRKADAVVAAGIAAIEAMEAGESADLAARDAVRDCLAGHPVPLAIRDFIVRYWQRLLADIHRKSGPDGSAWKIAVSTMANLVWSVEPKLDPVERASLVGLIPSLLKELNMAADSLDMPGDDRELFFATLVPCHTLALKAIVLEDAAMARPVMVETALPAMVESHEFEPVPTVATTRRAAPTPASAASAIEGLALGSWIECQRDDGGVVATRLSWVSPLKGIYMFADAQGRSVISITARGLQAKLRSGEVRILDDEPLMDRVVDDLMTMFRRDVLQ